MWYKMTKGIILEDTNGIITPFVISWVIKIPFKNPKVTLLVITNKNGKPKRVIKLNEDYHFELECGM